MRPLLQWFVATDRGRVREANEDSVIAYPIAEELARRPELVPPGGRLCVVADGMGGHRGGREASSMAVRRIAQFYYNQQGQRPSEALAAAIQQTSRDILLLGQSDPTLERMGTTVVLATEEEGTAHIANVGDSRAYHWRGGRLQIISVDDRWVAAQVRERTLTEEQARNHMYRSVLTQNLGSAEPIEPHMAEVALQPGDALLLCTDGLFELVSDEEIGRALSKARPDRVPQQLVDLALRRGAPDNVTVAVGYYGPQRPPRRTWPFVWIAAGSTLAALLAVALVASFAIGLWGKTSDQTVGATSRPAATATIATSPSAVPATSTSITVTEMATVAAAPESTETSEPTPTEATETAESKQPIIIQGPLQNLNDLTTEEKVVYESCSGKLDLYPDRAGVIIARSKSTDSVITFKFSTTPNEPQDILSGKNVRDGEYECAFILPGNTKVSVSGNDIRDLLTQSYSFEKHQIYLVKYNPPSAN